MAQPGTLARLLRTARERVHLTQLQLAERVGIAPNHINRLESGVKAVPRFDTVARLAAELGLSLDEIAWACGYTHLKTGWGRTDRAVLAQSANDVSEVLASVIAAESGLAAVRESLAPVAASLKRAGGIPASTSSQARKRKRKTAPHSRR